MSTQRWALTGLLVVALLASGASASLAQPAASSAAPASPAAPGAMLIVENAGQWPEAARFQVWNSPLGAGTTWLAEDGIWLVVSRQVDKKERARCDDPLVYLPTCLPVYSSHALKLTFPGSTPDVRIEPFEAADTTVSYFIGNDPDQWHPAVPVWSGVRYADLYPGVDLVLGGHDSAWRFEAAPGAPTEQVRVQIEGAPLVALDGAVMALEEGGEPLSVALPSAPFAYQATGLDSQGDALALTVPADAQPARAPAPADDSSDLIYSTFLGGSGFDMGMSIVVDEGGNAYVTGYTVSGDFPVTPGAFDPSYNGSSDAFVAKLNPTASALVYATFLGGTNGEPGGEIAVDGGGNAYVAGPTFSSDFPTTPGAFDPSYGGGICGTVPNTYPCRDAFVAKLNSAGSALVFSTYLGGGDDDWAIGIATDAAGSIYVAGNTASTDFPTTPGAFNRIYNGNVDAFVAELNPPGSSLAFASFLGGGDSDYSLSIAVDSVGSAFVTGSTRSVDFPTTPGAFDASFNGNGDAFVVKFNPVGSDLAYASFLGGGVSDSGLAIAVNGQGNACVTGRTESADFPTTPGAFDTSYNGGGDAFVAKLNPAGSALIYSTLLGTSGLDIAGSIAVDRAGNVFVSGTANSADFPTTPGAFDTSYNGGGDAFVAKFNPVGSALAYATFLGGSGLERGFAIAVDEAGSAYVSGYADSSDFPTTPSAFDTSYNGGNDAFATKLDTSSDQPCCDFDGDGVVDVDDIVIIAGLWGQEAGVPYDQDDDGWITIIDVQRIARWWDWPVP